MKSHVDVPLHQVCQSCSNGYLQQRADYANQAAALWDLKRFFVLPPFRGASRVVAVGWVGVRGNRRGALMTREHACLHGLCAERRNLFIYQGRRGSGIFKMPLILSLFNFDTFPL